MGMNDGLSRDCLHRSRFPARHKRPRCARRPASLELLEQRAMLSASPGISYAVETSLEATAGFDSAELELAPLFATATAAFTSLDPAGSLVGEFSTSGEISETNQVDDVLLSLEAGQRLTVIAEPSESLQPTIKLLDFTSSVILEGSGFGPGGTVVMQSFLISTSGNFRVTLEGIGQTTGEYDLRIYLNAAVELESLGASENNTLASAQNIGSSFIDLSGAAASRAAVVGTRGVDYAEDFESGMLNEEWSTSSVAEAGRIQLSNSIRAAQGEYSLIMDVSDRGVQNRNQADWSLDLSDVTDVMLRFSHSDFNDAEDPLPESFTGSADGDGIAISADGEQWTTIWQATDGTFGEWMEETVDLSAVATSSGMSLDNEFFIRFQQFGAGPLGAAGRGFDDIQLLTEPAVESNDWYRFKLEDGQAASVLLDTAADPRGTLELYDSAQTLLATSSQADNVDQILQNFVDATIDGIANDYYIRVTDPAEDYLLLVTRDASFDRELNSGFQIPQDLGTATEVIGFVDELSGASLNLIDSFPGPDFSGFVPPDPILAAGPSQIVAMVNTDIAIYDKASGVELFSESLNYASGFFGAVGATAPVFDPWVIYDDDSQRFFIVAIDVAEVDQSNLFLAVSDVINANQRNGLAQVSLGLYPSTGAFESRIARPFSGLRESWE